MLCILLYVYYTYIVVLLTEIEETDTKCHIVYKYST